MNRGHLDGVAVGGGIPSTGHRSTFITRSPSSAARRNGRFYTQSASGKSNSSIKRSWGRSHLSLAETRPSALSRGPSRPAVPIEGRQLLSFGLLIYGTTISPSAVVL